jgi:crooked neck
MEKILGNVAGVREVFERWMEWMPDQHAWLSYIKYELKYNEIKRLKRIFKLFVLCHPNVGAWLRYAKFEMKNGEVPRARSVYERAVENIADDDDDEAHHLFEAFAALHSCNEIERANCISKFALDHAPPKGRAMLESS